MPLVARVRAVMKGAGLSAMALWNTESGWWIERDDGEVVRDPAWLRRISPSLSGPWIARSLLLGRAAGLSRFYLYSWDNKDMGMIDPQSGKERPGAVASRTVSTWLAGNPEINCNQNLNTWICRVAKSPIDASDTEELIIWNGGTIETTFAIPAKQTLVAVDQLDGSTSSDPGLKKLRFVSISESPVRLTLKR